MWTCNRLDWQTLGSQPVRPKNQPDHWSHRLCLKSLGWPRHLTLKRNLNNLLHYPLPSLSPQLVIILSPQPQARLAKRPSWHPRWHRSDGDVDGRRGRGRARVAAVVRARGAPGADTDERLVKLRLRPPFLPFLSFPSFSFFPWVQSFFPSAQDSGCTPTYILTHRLYQLGSSSSSSTGSLMRRPTPHTSQEPWPWNCDSPKEKKSVPRLSQHTSKII